MPFVTPFLASLVFACAGAMTVSGERDEVAAVSAALARYHDGDARSDCRRWRVVVSRAGASLRIEIHDADGLDVVRRVGGPEVAAAVIDSWIRRDIPSRSGERARRRRPPLALAAPAPVPAPAPAPPLPAPPAAAPEVVRAGAPPPSAPAASGAL